ncbi:MAG: hypothetical protein ABI831_13000 [Betaproteobacteria bacterium]
MDSYVIGGTSPIVVQAASDARKYLSAAKSLFSGVAVLAQEAAGTRLACTILAGTVLEYALKAHLASVGYSANRLNHPPFGADLEALWFEAATHGLDVPAKPPRWCSGLNDRHGEKFPIHEPMSGAPEPSDLLLLTADLAALLALVNKMV